MSSPTAPGQLSGQADDSANIKCRARVNANPVPGTMSARKIYPHPWDSGQACARAIPLPGAPVFAQALVGAAKASGCG
jgi:hypothetical protein